MKCRHRSCRRHLENRATPPQSAEFRRPVEVPVNSLNEGLRILPVDSRERVESRERPFRCELEDAAETVRSPETNRPVEIPVPGLDQTPWGLFRSEERRVG